MRELERLRRARGLSQRELAKVSGVSPATIYELETGRRPAPRPSTLRKIADALSVEVTDLTSKEEPSKVEVNVRWRDSEDRLRGEALRFRGKEVDSYEHSNTVFTLYESPSGYRVHVEDHEDNTANLHPSEANPHTGEVEYLAYSAEELVEEFPEFGELVGVYRVRDLD